MYDNIPHELAARPQWVCWRYQTRQGRPTKIPYTPGTQTRASSTDPATWRTFDDAKRDRNHNGIGYVFTADDPYTGIDLDDCLVNGVLKPWAEAVLASLPPTYTEVSPSEHGLKLWVRGKLPDRSKHRRKMTDGDDTVGEIEVYDTGRFFTATGDTYPGEPAGVAEADIATWHRKWFPSSGPAVLPEPAASGDAGFPGSDDALIAAVRRSGSAKLFDSLWRGDLDTANGDHSSADLSLCNILAFWCGPNPARIDRLFRESGLYRDKWDRQDYRDRTIAEAVAGCKAHYSPPDAASRPRSDSDVLAKAAEAKPYMLTDIGNAERLAEHYRDRIRFCHQTSQWYLWDGQRWGLDLAGRITSYAVATVRMIYKESKACRDTDDKVAAEIAKHGVKSEAQARISAMIKLAASEPGVAVEVADLDADPWLLNTTNGTVDLRTGKLREHDPLDLNTQITTCGYHPGVACPTWLKFLSRIFHDNRELIDYVQELIGMCLSGDVSEQILPVFHGEGSNGKSTLLDTVMAVMGGYAGKAAPDLIMARKNETHPTEVADLWGKRLVVASETDEGRKLRTSFVKETTGDETLKARYMRGDFFTFRRTHKLVLMTNNKPRVTEGKHAIWRRLKLVPFTATIADSERDRQLGAKLRRESVGILAWMVEGCRRWHESGGFDEPVEIRQATEEYRDEENPLAEFVADCLVLDDGGFLPSREARRLYQAWCVKERIQHPLGDRALTSRLLAMPGVTKAVNKVQGEAVRGLAGVAQNPDLLRNHLNPEEN
jgi:putative DNA primase/helicase